MQAYSIRYYIKGTEKIYTKIIDAKDAKSARRKIGRMHGYEDGRMIIVEECRLIGYF